MAIIRDHDEIWWWYEKLEEQRLSFIGRGEFCKKYGIDVKLFSNMKAAIHYCKYADNKLYKHRMIIARKYIEEGTHSLRKFAEEHELTWPVLTQAATHYRYFQIINKLKIERGLQPDPDPAGDDYVAPSITENHYAEKALNFIKIPNYKSDQYQSLPSTQSAEPRPAINPTPQAEIMEKQNDIEIVITKGVKVSIAPNIDSMKIIKIIELLKDL